MFLQSTSCIVCVAGMEPCEGKERNTLSHIQSVSYNERHIKASWSMEHSSRVPSVLVTLVGDVS